MSLRTEFLEELNALAKKKQRDVSGLRAKMREVMVDRNPATLSPEEQDPVTTVALAWKEVSARGRVVFEEVAIEVVEEMERERVRANAAGCDWPLAHAVLRLLLMLPADKVAAERRALVVRLLAGMVAERSAVLTLLKETATETDGVAFWTDAFRLYLRWHELQPGWLETVWNQALADVQWPLEDAAFVFLEDAAFRFPEFVTMDRLVALWRAARDRSAGTEDVKRWFYVTGCALEDSPEGQAVQTGLHDAFGGHLQDQQLSAPTLPWAEFIEAAAWLFRNPAKKANVRASISKLLPKPKPKTEDEKLIEDRYSATSADYKDLKEKNINPNLLVFLAAA